MTRYMQHAKTKSNKSYDSFMQYTNSAVALSIFPENINQSSPFCLFFVECKVKSSKCEKCHDSCMQCKGPGPFNCTSCHLNTQLYVDEYRCVPCCKDAELMETKECCNCTVMSGNNLIIILYISPNKFF